MGLICKREVHHNCECSRNAVFLYGPANLLPYKLYNLEREKNANEMSKLKVDSFLLLMRIMPGSSGSQLQTAILKKTRAYFCLENNISLEDTVL